MKKIHISHMTIISLFILFLSICGIAACIIRIYAYHHPRPLAYFSEDNLKPGKYVSGTITSYVVSPRRPKGSQVDSSFGNYLDIFGNREYKGYIIPFNEEQYIRIWIRIKDEEALALLNESQDGLHVNVPFVGQIKADDNPSSWADDVLGFDHNKVITNYVIFQKDLSTEMFWIKVCLTGMIISFLFYWFKGRIVVSELVYEDKDSQSSSRYTDTPYADISYEIEIVERRIGMYGKWEKEYRKGGCIGAVCVVVGVFLFVKFGSFSALVAFILLTGYGIRSLWMYFINSTNSLAVFIANLFNLRTLQRKRMEDYKLLDNLKQKEDI